ncbi:MAG TPA: hypothetical protein VK724_15980 [Bryobacteraceae bacterium]|nr:hypothetical protein [Bryobacteraceae bacterium]
MKTNLIIIGEIFALCVLTLPVDANPVTFQAITYNFQLDGNGGGEAGTLNGVSVESFCDDFANDLRVPSSHTANVTQLSTTADLDETRFGEVTSWTTITLTGNTTDQTFLNTGAGSTAEARYAMVAWLVSQYNIPQNANPTVNAANNQIQEAIWTLMDPRAYASLYWQHPLIDPSGLGQPTADLEAAANWYLGGGATNSFLSHFEVVSDVNMAANPYHGNVDSGGFQEQIVYLPTPEPRAGSMILFALFGVGAFLKARAMRVAIAGARATTSAGTLR